MVHHKLVRFNEHHEIDWDALERVDIQMIPAGELVERDVEQYGVEQEENESELPGRTTWEAWKARKRVCAPL